MLAMSRISSVETWVFIPIYNGFEDNKHASLTAIELSRQGLYVLAGQHRQWPIVGAFGRAPDAEPSANVVALTKKLKGVQERRR